MPPGALPRFSAETSDEESVQMVAPHNVPVRWDGCTSDSAASDDSDDDDGPRLLQGTLPLWNIGMSRVDVLVHMFSVCYRQPRRNCGCLDRQTSSTPSYGKQCHHISTCDIPCHTGATWSHRRLGTDLSAQGGVLAQYHNKLYFGYLSLLVVAS